MDRIASFSVDHRFIKPGIYISRVDGDITTYDLRTRKPNIGDLMSNEVMHSTEHLFATFIRNSDLKGQVLYFGPMGCQTGYYLLIRDAEHNKVIETVKQTLKDIIAYNGPMPGKSERECGNYKNLDVNIAKDDCKMYYNVIKDWKEKDLIYPKGMEKQGFRNLPRI